MSYKINWKNVSENVRENVEGGIDEVECIDIDAVTSSDSRVPSFPDRTTLKKAGYDIA